MAEHLSNLNKTSHLILTINLINSLSPNRKNFIYFIRYENVFLLPSGATNHRCIRRLQNNQKRNERIFTKKNPRLCNSTNRKFYNPTRFRFKQKRGIKRNDVHRKKKDIEKQLFLRPFYRYNIKYVITIHFASTIESLRFFKYIRRNEKDSFITYL